MKYVEFAEKFVNIDNINFVHKRTEKNLITKMHDDEGNLHEVAKGRPYQIVLDFGNAELIMLYENEPSRDTNFARLKDVLEVDR